MLHRILRNDYVALAKFMVPLAFTDVAVDIGEQVNTQFALQRESTMVCIVVVFPVFEPKYCTLSKFCGHIGCIRIGVCHHQVLCGRG